MKEININIEGYNVNGICVGCLNYNRKMFYHSDVKDCFKTIANIDVPDGLSIQVCWECMASVRSYVNFKTQILSAYSILIKYSRQHTFLNSPKDLTQYADTRLAETQVDLFDSTEASIPCELQSELKTELKDDQVHFETESIKEEDTEYSHFSVEFPALEHNDSQEQISSDEDVQLSQIKQEKEKEKKKKKKKNESDQVSSKSRKLKNLPRDIVELYTMTEEEMWEVRASDVASEVFQNLRHKCDLCIIGFNTQKLKEYHDNGKHKPKSAKSHQCDVCRAYFLTRDNLSVHRSLHLAAYRCRVCGARTAIKRLMLSHACAKSSAATLYTCAECRAQFSSKSRLAYHRTNVCRQEKPQCDCCGKVFANKMTLKYHLKLLPQKKENKPKDVLYIPCKGCSKVFHSKKSYRAHVVIHEGVTYPCPTCGKLFQWKRNLARHARAHRERDAGATPRCRDCDKTFSSRDCYNNHMRLSKRHAADTAYVHECNYCGKKFPTKWCMVDHIDWDHLKRVKYQCSVCFKPFKTAKIMVAHMNNIHEGKKQEPEGEHLCDICGKSYKTVKRLKAHAWSMHTQRSNAKSYKCKLCAATFTWQTSIYKHMKMMHDSKRTKAGRAPSAGAVKKQEPYPDMQYYTHLTLQPLPQNIV